MNLLNAFSRLLIGCGAGLMFGCFTLNAFGAPSLLKDDEEVVFYPTAAQQVTKPGDIRWRVPLHIQVFEMEPRRFSLAAAGKLLGLDADSLGLEEQQIFKTRARWFLVDNQRRKRVLARVGNEQIEIGPTGSDGVAVADVELSSMAAGRWLAHADTNYTNGRRFAGEVFLIPPRGWSVISDIDDTIKVSEVRNSEALLKNTFCLPFKPVAGMADLYRQWQIEKDCAFFYVSGSPWALYLPLQEFLQTNRFPAGIFHLRRFNLGNKSALNLLKSPVDYKTKEINGILRRFPSRQYILVGDSGEMDPEIYGAVTRAHPDKIQRIYIRDVSGEETSSPRYQRAFREIPATQWQVFRQPSEINRNQFK